MNTIIQSNGEIRLRKDSPVRIEEIITPYGNTSAYLEKLCSLNGLDPGDPMSQILMDVIISCEDLSSSDITKSGFHVLNDQWREFGMVESSYVQVSMLRKFEEGVETRFYVPARIVREFDDIDILLELYLTPVGGRSGFQKEIDYWLSTMKK